MANINDGRPTDSRPLTDLIGGLASDVTGLFRKEIQLAKAEASEKASQVLGGVELLAAGGVLALGALGVLLSAAVTALAAFLVSRGMGATGANSLSALIVGILVAIVAYVLVNRGLAAFKASNLSMDKTVSSLERDAAVVKERL